MSLLPEFSPESGGVTLLTIESGSGSFQAPLNPNQISHSTSFNFTEKKGMNDAAAEQKFNNAGEDSINFTIILDGTGATGLPVDVKNEIDNFKETTAKYIGDKHEPEVVTITYGTTIDNWQGRLQSLNITYQMFAPDGKPLRAELQATFKHSQDAETTQQRQSANSPDLSHLVVVKEGDNLPLMCQNTYGDSAYYLQVAKINNLVDFRNLQPGTELLFPPLK